MKYRATAYNKDGDTFLFHFNNPNWNGIDEAANNALNNIVSNDKFHQKHGPWCYRNIDKA